MRFMIIDPALFIKLWKEKAFRTETRNNSLRIYPQRQAKDIMKNISH